MVDSSRVRVVAICVFRHDDRLLVIEGFDKVKRSFYHRPLGGGVEFGETSQEAVQREIREETGQEITDLRLLGVLENLFVCDGKPGHEIVFVYDGRFVDEAMYGKESMTLTEDGGETFRVTWRPLASFDDQHRLVPEQLWDLLGGR